MKKLSENSYFRWLKHRLDQAALPESVQIGAAAVVVGLLGGAGVWLFKQLISLVQQLAGALGGTLQPLGGWTAALLPALGGLVVGLVAVRFIGRERYHGLSAIIEACALAGGRLPFRKAPVRVVAAAISIGAGASVGPEDPSVQVGANLGSLVGQALRFSEEHTRALVAGGAAAGIAAAFNAPIAGVFFALEVLLGELSGSSFAFAAIASVISAIFTQAVSGTQPAFSVPPYSLNSIAELPLYLVLGLLSGPLAAAYIRLIYLARASFHALALPEWAKPALAGLVVGLVGIFLPQVLGVGYGTIADILSGGSHITILMLLALLVAKLVLTPLSIGGGFVGGVFAPSLFLGASLGGAFGLALNGLFPGLGASPTAYAMVGMAAVLAGTVHAPLTAVLLLFEMTQDYRIILPLMFAVAVSLVVSRRLQKDSVYLLPLVQNGIRLESGRDVEVLEGLSVSEVMTRDWPVLSEGDSAMTAMDQFGRTRSHGLPVLDRRGELVGMLTLQDLEKVVTEEGKQKTAGELCTRDLLTVFPDESIGTALRRMGGRDIGRLPVVNRANPRQLVGLLRRSDVIRAYDVALARHAAMRHRTAQARLGILSGVAVHELQVQAGSPCAGKHIGEVSWPRDCVISTIRRGQAVLLPHGDTLLQASDVLVVVTEGSGLEEARALCQK